MKDTALRRGAGPVMNLSRNLSKIRDIAADVCEWVAAVDSQASSLCLSLRRWRGVIFQRKNKSSLLRHFITVLIPPYLSTQGP